MKTIKYFVVFLFSCTVILSASSQETTKCPTEKKNVKKSNKVSQAQSGKSPFIINLDFAEKKFENLGILEEISRGDFYQLKIKNINLNLYNVLIENKDSSLNNVVEFPTFDLMNIDNLSKIIGGLSPLATISGTKITSQQVSQGTPYTETKKNIIERMNKELKFLLKINNRIYIKNLSLDSLQLSLNKRALSYFVEKNSSDYFNYLKSSFNIENAFKKAEELRSNTKGILMELSESYLNYELYTSENKLVIENDTTLNQRNKTLNEAYSIANQNITNLYSFIDAGKVYAWFSSLTLLENNNSGEFVSLPLQKEGDITYLKINIVPKKSEYGLSSYQSNLQFPIYTKSYLGIGMGYYISNLYNEAFSINSTIVDTVKSFNIIDENTSDTEIGFATLLYYGTRFNKSKFGFHFTIGPAFSISNKIKPRLTSGAGFSFGKKQMLSFDILLIVGYVDRLSNAYPINEVFSDRPENITVSKLKYGAAISFGYIYKF